MSFITRVSGDLSRWDDLRFPAEAVRINPVTSHPDYGALVGNMKCLLFDGSTEEDVTFVAQFPHGYVIGSNVIPHVHWCPTTTNVGTVVWQLEYSWFDTNGTAGTPTLTISGSVSFTTNSQYKSFYTSFPAVSGTAITGLSSIMMGRLSRRADLSTDNYADDAGMLEFDIHYELDTYGSEAPTSK